MLPGVKDSIPYYAKTHDSLEIYFGVQLKLCCSFWLCNSIQSRNATIMAFNYKS